MKYIISTLEHTVFLVVCMLLIIGFAITARMGADFRANLREISAGAAQAQAEKAQNRKNLERLQQSYWQQSGDTIEVTICE